MQKRPHKNVFSLIFKVPSKSWNFSSVRAAKEPICLIEHCDAVFLIGNFGQSLTVRVSFTCDRVSCADVFQNGVETTL